MNDTTGTSGYDDVEQQIKTIRDDITTLSELLKDIGEAKAGAKREAALAEAAQLLEKSRTAIDEGRLKARHTTAVIEDHIRKQPVQSALIALGVGLLFGMMTRR